MNFTYKTKMTATSEQPSFPIIGLEETDSTNRYLSDLCDNAPTAPIEYTTVTARFQTSGKGQRGNSWESEAGQNLLFSTVLYPRFVEARHQFVLSQIVSLAVKEELDTYTEGISIKWPNDIYWHEKKICGMLIENVLEGNRIGRCIPGIGINLNQTVFRSPAPNPVSLKQITGRDYDAPTVLDGFLRRLYTYYEALRRDTDGRFAASIARRYADALFRREGLHPYEDADGRFLARLADVEPDGRFVLQDEAGRLRRYLFKEVQYIL